jgi:hypothetical protein
MVSERLAHLVVRCAVCAAMMALSRCQQQAMAELGEWPTRAAGTAEELLIDGKLVNDVLAGEQRLTAAIQRCSGLIVRERLASPTATSAGAHESIEERVRFGLSDKSVRAEFLSRNMKSVSHAYLLTPSSAFMLLAYPRGNRTLGVLKEFPEPAAPEVSATIETSVIALVGALIGAPGLKGSDYLATKVVASRYSSADVLDGIRISSSFVQGDQAAEKTDAGTDRVAAADFEMVIDTRHDFAIRAFRTKTVAHGGTSEIERTISLVPARGGSYVPAVVSTAIRMTSDLSPNESRELRETATLTFDDAVPSPDTFTRRWLRGLVDDVSTETIDANGVRAARDLPPISDTAPGKRDTDIDRRPPSALWIVLNVGIVAILVMLWFGRKRFGSLPSR